MIKVFRASGNPVEYDHINKFTEEHREIYDKVIKKFNLGPTDTLSPELSQRLNKLFDRLNKTLMKKYPVESQWQEVKSKEEWSNLVDKHGSIMITKNQETNELVYVIFDVEV